MAAVAKPTKVKAKAKVAAHSKVAAAVVGTLRPEDAAVLLAEDVAARRLRELELAPLHGTAPMRSHHLVPYQPLSPKGDLS